MNNKQVSYACQAYNPVTTIDDVFDGEKNTDEYDLLIFIARAQPFHYGHKRVVDVALFKSKKVLVLLGSQYSPRTIRNPFNVDERYNMIQNSYTSLPNGKLNILGLEDHLYNDNAWVEDVQRNVLNFCYEQNMVNPKIGLIGCAKDASSYYLKLFPTWGSVNVHFLNPLNATDIRNRYFDCSDGEFQYFDKGNIPANVMNFLLEFKKTEDFSKLKEEINFVDKFKKSWEKSPYPPTFNTVDSIVVQSGHILLVERGHHPGKGLFALPGGYINQNETLLESALRELREETKIKVPEPVLKGSVVSSKTFDDPNRSSRGRTITHAFYFKLQDQLELPKVKGSDDAKKAFWLPLAELSPHNMFEDHLFIIKNMIGV